MYVKIIYYFEQLSKHGLENVQDSVMREKMQLANKISITMIFVLQFYLTINFIINFLILDFILGQLFFVVAASYFVSNGRLKEKLFFAVWGYALSPIIFINSIIYKFYYIDLIPLTKFIQPKLYLIGIMTLIMAIIPHKKINILKIAIALNFSFLLFTDIFDYFFSIYYTENLLLSNDLTAISITAYLMYIIIFLILFYFRQNITNFYEGVINNNILLQNEYQLVINKFDNFKSNYETIINEMKGKEDYYKNLEKMSIDLLETEKAFKKIKDSNSEILNPISQMMNDKITGIRHKIKDIITHIKDIDIEEIEKKLKLTYSDIVGANEIIFELMSWVRSNNGNKMKLEKVNITELCKNQVYIQRFSLKKKGMEVDSRYRDSIDVKIQKRTLENILKNVLNLIINMSDKNSKVSISTEKNAYNYLINISIPSSKKIIFSEYDPNSLYPKEDALNMKYKVSKKIIESIGGQISEKYNYNNLLTIKMNLPLN